MHTSCSIVRSAAAALGLAAVLSASQSFADDDIEERSFNIVGSWSVGTPYPRHEVPFWTKTLPEASGGRLSATVQGFDQLGLGGPAVFEMVGQGVYDIGASVIDYVSGDEPMLEGLDLPAVADPQQAKKVLDAYRPHLEKAFEETYNAVFLASIPQTPQVFFCNAEVNGLADLSGKRIRGSGRMTMDFIAAVGGVGVSLAFNEMPVALDRGVVDCGVTGVLSGYTGGWSEVSSHLYMLPAGGWDHVAIVANKDVWDSLNDATRGLLRTEIEKMEANAWDAIRQETQEGIDCNTGGECAIGAAHSMVAAEVTAEDQASAIKLIEERVLPGWAERCDESCVENWNASIGQVLGITAARQ